VEIVKPPKTYEIITLYYIYIGGLGGLEVLPPPYLLQQIDTSVCVL
jgi:hypothetical protein